MTNYFSYQTIFSWRRTRSILPTTSSTRTNVGLPPKRVSSESERFRIVERRLRKHRELAGGLPRQRVDRFQVQVQNDDSPRIRAQYGVEEPPMLWSICLKILKWPKTISLNGYEWFLNYKIIYFVIFFEETVVTLKMSTWKKLDNSIIIKLFHWRIHSIEYLE
jgi:hypothetical protein